jgi:hypothetical protein
LRPAPSFPFEREQRLRSASLRAQFLHDLQTTGLRCFAERVLVVLLEDPAGPGCEVFAAELAQQFVLGFRRPVSSGIGSALLDR